MREAVEIKILLLGDTQVGKSTFLTRMKDESQKTLLCDADQPFDFRLSTRKRDYSLLFHDTSYPSDWRSLEPDLIILCYDIACRSSLINLQATWIKEVHRCFAKSDADLPVMVLGLKRDLRSEHDPNGPIYPQEAYQLVQQMRVDRYAECSAVTGELFDIALQEVFKIVRNGQSDGGCIAM